LAFLLLRQEFYEFLIVKIQAGGFIWHFFVDIVSFCQILFAFNLVHLQNQNYALYQLRTEVPPKIQRSIWELILMHLPSTKMLAQYLVEVLSTALNSLVAGLTSLKIWSTKSAKKRHLCASISAHSLHWWDVIENVDISLLLSKPGPLQGAVWQHFFD
jgi:hypothetical protein